MGPVTFGEKGVVHRTKWKEHWHKIYGARQVTAQNGALEREGGQEEEKEVTENWEIRNVDEEEEEENKKKEEEEEEEEAVATTWTARHWDSFSLQSVMPSQTFSPKSELNCPSISHVGI